MYKKLNGTKVLQILPRTAGATGLVGSRLVAKLAAQGHTARVLTRNVDAARAKLPFPRTEFFAPAQWGAAVCGARGVVNLAGAPRLQGACVSGQSAGCFVGRVRHATRQATSGQCAVAEKWLRWSWCLLPRVSELVLAAFVGLLSHWLLTHSEAAL